MNIAHSALKVYAFLLDDEGFILDLCPDGADVFSDYTNEDELHGREEKEPYHERSEADHEVVPEGELVDEIYACRDETEGGQCKADERRKAKWQLCVVDESRHGIVVEREEVVLRLAARSCLLFVRDFDALEADFRDKAAHIGVWLVELS